MSETTATSQTISNAPLPPGPRGHWLMGIMPAIDRDPIGAMSSMTREYGDIVRYPFLIWYSYLINHPDYVKRVLVDNQHNYSKDNLSFRNLKTLVGNGLLTSDGEFWLRQRRLIQPAFHRKQIQKFSEIMSTVAQETVQRWRGPEFQEKPFDISAEMMRLTLSVVGQALFSQDLSNEAKTVGRSFTIASEDISERARMLLKPPLSVPTPRNRRIKAALNSLDEVVNHIILKRRADLDAGTQVEEDLLTTLIKAQDQESGERMTDQQLRDEVMTLLLAGHETTANALSWTWYLLSQHPDTYRRLREELDTVLNGRNPTMEDLSNLPYNQMVIQESMRLYPPAWFISRLAEGEDEIGGYRIPAKSLVSFSPYLMHHNPQYWDNPEGFDPDRFSPENMEERPAYAYFPFGGGQRMCIGRDFAMAEAQIVLATLASHYRADLVSGCQVEMDPLITLRPKTGIWVTLH